MTLLVEDNHPLITPQFSGTAEEITTALRCWADIIENFRFLDVRVTAYDNRSKIIDHLQRELEALAAELDNKSAVLSGDGGMKQSIEGSAQVDQPVAATGEPINLAPQPPTAAEAAASHAARYAPPTTSTSPKLGSMIANFNATR